MRLCQVSNVYTHIHCCQKNTPTYIGSNISQINVGFTQELQ